MFNEGKYESRPTSEVTRQARVPIAHLTVDARAGRSLVNEFLSASGEH